MSDTAVNAVVKHFDQEGALVRDKHGNLKQQARIAGTTHAKPRCYVIDQKKRPPAKPRGLLNMAVI